MPCLRPQATSISNVCKLGAISVLAALTANTPSWATSDSPIALQKMMLSKHCTLVEKVKAVHFKFEVTVESSERPEKYRLTQVFCNGAAYNTSEVWLLQNEDRTAQVISFAVPQFNVTYEDQSEQEKVTDITITGYSAEFEISNSFFDPATKTISSFHKWRGVGDASSGGVWEFRDRRFVLQSYAVDASWDGEINAQTIVDFSRAQK